MRKGDNIRGYEILEDFTVAGGQSKISFAYKGGKEYFIKEFLAPKYPTEGAPGNEKAKKKKRKRCKAFEQHHESINAALRDKCSLGGNLVYAIDFFRDKTTYYKINERVDTVSISPLEISKLELSKILLIAKTVVHSLKILHTSKIIHGDLKPDNILIKETETGAYTTKLIDFDNSFFETKPPDIPESIVGDQVYYSPELAAYIAKEGTASAHDLTVKSDIFALGIILHQYFFGELPSVASEYNYIWEAVADKQVVSIKHKKELAGVVELLEAMLQLDYHKRPSTHQVFTTLKTIGTPRAAASTTKTATKSKIAPKGKLKGTLLQKDKLPREKKDNPIEEKKGKLRGKLINKKRHDLDL